MNLENGRRRAGDEMRRASTRPTGEKTELSVPRLHQRSLTRRLSRKREEKRGERDTGLIIPDTVK
jgi:hypothetical protein